MQKRLFIISNRLPINFTEQQRDAKTTRSTGGLVTAISSYLSDLKKRNVETFAETYWVGVPGCTPDLWNKAMRDPDDPEYTYLPVFINKKCYEAYYNGLSNSVIWPLFHYFPSFVEYNAGYFDNYMLANKEFMEVILKNIRPGDTLWIHDYHLMPLAAMIRKAMPGVTIGFFLHIPFPSYELFRIIPKKWQEEIIKGVLGADLIGFHTIDYASHFLKCVQMILGPEDDMHILRYEDRLIKVDVFPVSIDYAMFHNAWDDKKVTQLRTNLRTQFSDKKIIFSADRLDYTKGVHSRLKAFDHFLQKNPEYHGKVVFVLIVVPSRDTISRYAERKKMIDEYIGDINSRLGNIVWQPIIYQYTNLEVEELIAMYTSCDVALITPLRDGMNLVAKEFVASRKDRQGVLVLSEMAGAAKELTGALIINPNDEEDIAEKIRTALEMKADEQEKRMITMQERIAKYNITAWADDFMQQLQSIREKQKEFEVKFIDGEGRREIIDEYRQAERRLLLLDYDGTLVPFSDNPSEAAPGTQLLEVLTKLAFESRNHIYIISGRDSGTLEKWLGHLPVSIISEHGAKYKPENGEWEQVVRPGQEWKHQVAAVMDTYVHRCANSFAEIKDYSIAWHYRNSNQEQAKLRSAELYAELLEFIKHKDLNVIHGNKVIEVRNHGVDKGIAVKKILGRESFDFILAIGDDITDEDMFRTLSPVSHAYTLKVGNQASFARYNLHTSYMALSLLELISNVAYPPYTAKDRDNLLTARKKGTASMTSKNETVSDR